MSFGLPSSMFNVMPVLVSVIFILVICIIIVAVVRGVRQWSHNNAQPKIPAEARVVSKRADVSHHHHGDAGDMHHHTSSTTYYATFEYTTGDRVELHVPANNYGMLAENDAGILISQGTRFISFERQ